MKYLPLTDDEVSRVLQATGAASFEDLIRGIPSRLRTQTPYATPGPFDELALMREFEEMESHGRHIRRTQCFLGGGCYPHFIPAAVDALASRGEFLTAYTPYQPEVSQGTLQVAFEFQTYVCLLTGMEVANASMYDGATALAEACLMAHRLSKRKSRLVISRAVHPEYREVVRTLTQHLGFEMIEVPFTAEGLTDHDALRKALDGETFAVAVQSPNALGLVEDLQAVGRMAHAQPDCRFIVAVTEGLSLGLLAAPGDRGADLVVGEGQSWGIPMAFGGPHLGWFATQESFVRQMPGRLCGLTQDAEGRRAFTLTLSTREQHIRRERATSNICTNQGAMALRATIYLSLLGRQGMSRLARANHHATRYALERLRGIPGVEVVGGSRRFNEIAFAFPSPMHKGKALAFFQAEGLQGGLDLARWYPEMDRHLLSTFTELHAPRHIEPWLAIIKRALR